MSVDKLVTYNVYCAMLLAIDIGNTNVVLGIFDGDILKATSRMATLRNATTEEVRLSIFNFFEQHEITIKYINKVILASVVPSLTTTYIHTIADYFRLEPIVISHKLKLPIHIEIDQPEQIGADRIANAVGGFVLYGSPIIVVDFGTATTFDIISGDGTYIGGVIAPGPETSMAELARKAARLFEVRVEPPKSVIGKSTAAAMKSGLFYGTVGQVDYIIDRILDECAFDSCKVIATGGLSSNIEKYSRHIEQVVSDLTLQGLRIIVEG